MRSRLARFWPLTAPLFVLACGGSAPSQPTDKGGFQPIPTLQPTESGPWVVDADDPLTLYALGDRSLRSKDGGHTWSELGWPAGAEALLFSHSPVPAMYLQVRAPASPSVAVGVAPSRLLRSSDGGLSWTEVGTVAGGYLTLVSVNAQPIFLISGGAGIWRSSDEGATWVASPVSGAMSLVPPQFDQALTSSDADGVLYIPAVLFGATGFEPTVLVSTDTGLTFESKAAPGNLNSSFPPRLSIDCQGRLYVLDGRTVRRSSDAGSTWQAIATLEASVEEFHVAPTTASECSETVYAFGESAQEPRLWRLDPDGTVSTQAPALYGAGSDLGRDRLLLVPAYRTLRQRSDDGGRSWWTAGIALGGTLALSPAQQGLLFAAQGDTVSRSDDGGKSWTVTSTPSETGVQKLYLDAADPALLFGTTTFGSEFVSSPPAPLSFISTDGGASFQNWPVPTADNPELPAAIASSKSGTVTVVTSSAVYSTDDRGQHFATLLRLSRGKSIVWAGIGASDPPSIYASVAGDNTTGNKVVVSLDGGKTWSSSDPGTPLGCLTPFPDDPRIAFACHVGPEGGLLRTLDGGNTWSDVGDFPASARGECSARGPAPAMRGPRRLTQTRP